MKDSAPFIIEIDTKNWQPGKKWSFFVRRYDALGNKGGWSPASDLTMIGVSLKLNVGGRFKDSAKRLLILTVNGSGSEK